MAIKVDIFGLHYEVNSFTRKNILINIEVLNGAVN